MVWWQGPQVDLVASCDVRMGIRHRGIDEWTGGRHLEAALDSEPAIYMALAYFGVFGKGVENGGTSWIWGRFSPIF